MELLWEKSGKGCSKKKSLEKTWVKNDGNKVEKANVQNSQISLPLTS